MVFRQPGDAAMEVPDTAGPGAGRVLVVADRRLQIGHKAKAIERVGMTGAGLVAGDLARLPRQ